MSRANGLIVLSICDDRIRTITRFGAPDIVARFGLSLTLANTRTTPTV
ncbi:MAG: hypothetical protein ABI706_11255 [Ilumatobacteraceae bacterium]